MTADSGYIKCSFYGPEEALAAAETLIAQTSRQNEYSCGLSWLDELDSELEAEAECVSYDTLDATREFLAALLTAVPEIEFDGILEHSWPVLPSWKTIVEFSSQSGSLLWEERQQEEEDLPWPIPEEYEEDDEEDPEIPYPTQPW